MRDSVLSSIRQSLNRAGYLPTASPRAAIPRPAAADRDQLIAEFAAEWRQLGGRFEEIAAERALTMAVELLRAAGARRVLSWPPEHMPPPLADLPPALREAGMSLVEQRIPREPHLRGGPLAEIESADAGLTGAEAAIAQVGGVVVRSGRGRGRLASLIVPLHIIFLAPPQFYPTVEDWWPNASVEASSLTVIAGPSRSTDIERVLTLGVHGPKEVIAVCLRQ